MDSTYVILGSFTPCAPFSRLLRFQSPASYVLADFITWLLPGFSFPALFTSESSDATTIYDLLIPTIRSHHFLFGGHSHRCRHYLHRLRRGTLFGSGFGVAALILLFSQTFLAQLATQGLSFFCVSCCWTS